MKNNYYILDNTSKNDILDKFRSYAKEYTPEWNLDYNNPDIGTVIGMIFADQMEENVKKYNEALDIYHYKFIDMLKLSLYPPKPARATVSMQLINDSTAGLILKKGTKFITDVDDKTIVFQSMGVVYITVSKIDTIIMKDSINRWRMVLGKFQIPSIINNVYKESVIDTMNDIEAFCVKKNQLDMGIVISHSYIFKGMGDKISIKFHGAEELCTNIENGSLELYLISDDEVNHISDYSVEDNNIIFSLISSRTEKILIKAVKEINNEVFLKGISINAFGTEKNADYVLSDIKDCKADNFEPFGEIITPYSQCSICSNNYFSKKSAIIIMEFDVEYGENLVGQIPKKEENLKIIKRKKIVYNNEIITDAYVDKVIFEYETGRGYRVLELEKDSSYLFRDGISGHKKISFRCPKEWEETESGSYTGKMMRIRVIKSDNCYLQPCIHHYPIIRNLKISYSYKNESVMPEKVEVIEGFNKSDITDSILKEKNINIFETACENKRTKMYMGFDKELQGGPVSILFSLKNDLVNKKSSCVFYYYGSGEWRRLKVIDKTDDFMHSGIVLFYPPKDMEKYSDFGQERYFICVEGIENGAVIKNISFNGIETENVNTSEPEDYYIDYVESNMTFPIDGKKLLYTDVWVNEIQDLTIEEMLDWKEKEPDDIMTEYDYFGKITAFYVKWHETDNFYSSDDTRVYVLDRSGGRICFGDGIHNKIPRNTSDTAFKVIAHYCDGREGNVESGEINNTISNILYVDNIKNLEPAYGGDMQESYERLLYRGSSVISSHERLISKEDYVRAVMGYSDLIHKVKCSMNNQDIYIALLLSDYKKSSGSFYKLRSELKKYLLERSDMTITSQNMHIIEPVFVSVHISLWIKVSGEYDTFSISTRIKERIERYLDPITGKDGNGWDIGGIPEQSQLIMEINSMREDFLIRNILITASYTDEKGMHECSPDRLGDNTYAVIKSGNHNIYVE